MTFIGFLKRLFHAPWIVLAFLVLPGILITQRMLHLPLIDPRFVMYDVILFVVYLLAVLGMRISRLRRRIRLGDTKPFFLKRVDTMGSPAVIRKALEADGYFFTDQGNYAEKRDRGYGGGILFLVGFVILLTVGSYDNLRNLSGTVLLAVGQPIKLFDRVSYTEIGAGPWADLEKFPYQLQVSNQIHPTTQAPKGAAEINLLGRDGALIRQAAINPETPLSIDDFRIHMAGFVYDAWVVIVTSKDHTIFTDWVKLKLDKKREGAYLYSGAFRDDFAKVEGRARYAPETERLKIEAALDGKKIVDAVLAYRHEEGGYITTMPGIGKWCEFRVVRKRHLFILAAGAIMTVLGGALRLWFRPKRVWIEERAGISRIATTDTDVKKLFFPKVFPDQERRPKIES